MQSCSCPLYCRWVLSQASVDAWVRFRETSCGVIHWVHCHAVCRVVHGWPGPCWGAGRAVGGGRCVLLPPIQTVPQRESGSSGRPELEELQDGHSRALNPHQRPLNPQQDFSGHETPKGCTSCKAVQQTLNVRYILLRKIFYSYSVVFSLFPLNGLFLLLSLLTILYTCSSKVKTSVLVHLKQRLVLGFLLSRWVIEHLAIFTVVVQSLSHVRLFAFPWTAARQASLSLIIS